jgi:hypothetical protein
MPSLSTPHLPFFVRLFVAALLLLPLANSAVAQERLLPRTLQPRGETVRRADVSSRAITQASVELWVVEARKTPGRTDVELQPFARELRSKGFQSFALRARVDSRLGIGELAQIPVDQHRVEIRLLEISGDQARVRVRLARSGERTLEFTMTLPRNRTLLWGGPRTANGVMVLPITVRW